MSKYIYSLSNYRAIKNADIEIDGITVLAGENGAGKSTLSRLLYDVVKAITMFEQYAENEARNEVLSVMSLLRRSYSFMRPSRYREFLIPINDINRILHTSHRLDDLNEAVGKILNNYKEEMLALLAGDVRNRAYYMSRMATLFNMEDTMSREEEPVSFLDTICNKLLRRVNTAVSIAEDRKTKRRSDTLFEFIADFDEQVEGEIRSLRLSEDGVELLETFHFGHILNINRVIYFKTSELLDYIGKPSDLHTCLETPIDKMCDDEKVLAKIFQSVLKGKMGVNEDGVLRESQFMYQREDGLQIPLAQAATGLVSLSFLYRLLENGYLRKGTLLIIDEPEAHLHPKWIVEYARMIVLLQKEMDLKVVLSTHNPDMVAAIDSISRKEGIGSRTNFYFAKPFEKNTFQYVYEKQNSISGVFDSFNVALTRIQEYGAL